MSYMHNTIIKIIIFLPPTDTILLTDAASCKSTEVKSVFILIKLEIKYNSFREKPCEP